MELAGVRNSGLVAVFDVAAIFVNEARLCTGRIAYCVISVVDNVSEVPLMDTYLVMMAMVLIISYTKIINL